jgi:hypothetical protein
MQGMEDLWHDLQCDEQEHDNNQGADEEYTAQLYLFHARMLLPCSEDFPPGTWNVPPLLYRTSSLSP